jgi:type II secretory pathway predicted ATPase ExeA
MDTLRRLRLLFSDFPHTHNLILFGQPQLLSNLSLGVYEDIKSRITYSVCTLKLGPDDMEQFLLAQMDHCGLAHSVISPEAMVLGRTLCLRKNPTLFYLLIPSFFRSASLA